MPAQPIYFGFGSARISAPRSFKEASSINFTRSCRYGIGVLGVSAQVMLRRLGVGRYRFLDPEGARIRLDAPRLSAQEAF